MDLASAAEKRPLVCFEARLALGRLASHNQSQFALWMSQIMAHGLVVSLGGAGVRTQAAE